MASPAPLVQPREGITGAVEAAIGDAFLSAKDEVGEVSIDVRRESVADVLRTLRDAFDYQQLMEIAGVDYAFARLNEGSRTRHDQRSIVPSRRIFRCSCMIP